MGPELICPWGYRRPAIQRERNTSKDNVTVDSGEGGGGGEKEGQEEQCN